MKKGFLLILLLSAGVLAVLAQTCGTGDCDCASCKAKAEGTFTLPGLQGLENRDAGSVKQEEHTEGDHDHGNLGHDEGPAHDHAIDPVVHDHDGDGVPDHDTHDDPTLEAIPHDHDGDGVPDHDSLDGDGHVEGGIELSAEMIQKVGIQIQEAEGGTIARATVFPAEIKLNRDRTAAVSPRYASIVRQVFAEIGDAVKKGDVLASLENRETMAVYTVAAPLDGVIISKNLAVGETAGEDRVLYEVADLSTVWADISIFPKYQHLLRKGMQVKFIAHDGHSTKGVVKYISPIVSHETRTFTARCVLEGAGEDFTPGAFVRAQIQVEAANVPVTIPREAVQTLEGETVVFVPGDHGFLAVPVELGLTDEHSVEIRNGLKTGNPYVAVGAFALKAQMVTSGMDPHAGHGH